MSGDGLAEKMVEILDATSKYQQQVEVISAALPEIIPDQNHATTALHLQKMVITTYQKHIAPLEQHTVTVTVLALAEALLESSKDIVVIFAKQMYSSDFSKLRSY